MDSLAPPSSLHERAANGEGDAFAGLANLSYNQAFDGSEPPALALSRAAIYARLAVVSRNTREDWVSFLFILDQQASALRAAGYPASADKALAEAVALAEFAGEEGDEELGQLVVAAGDALSPETLKLARQLRENVKGVLGC